MRKKKKNDKSMLEENEKPFLLSVEHCALISKLMDWLIDPAVSFVRKGCKEVINCLDQQLAIGTMRLMETIFAEVVAKDESLKKKKNF